MPAGATEYSYTIDRGWSGFRLQPQAAADIQVSLQEGSSNTNYWTVRQAPARYFEQTDLIIDQPLTLYFRSAVANKLEVMLLG